MKKIIPTLIIGTMAGLSANAYVDKNFNYHVDRFADIEVLRYEVPEFDRLTPRQRTMVYYLTQAAQMGRDIIWDQNGRYNLQIRQLLERIYQNYDGDRESADFKAFEKYLKQVWFGNGIHHHYS
ncbi:MAG: dihydrofolate reductase, partial [Muribaculaceae bacterium]|nr:dihydrofolate reductase [Muribaculaceae bacterium]